MRSLHASGPKARLQPSLAAFPPANFLPALSLVEWPKEAAEPTKYFLCDLPADYSLRRLVRVAKSRWKIEQDYQQLKEELGLDHYEGRSWSGWHHHVTLVMLAHSFLTLETLRNPKNFWLDPAEDAS